MNIDWTELAKGISTELSDNSEKTAGVPLGTLARKGGAMLAKNLPYVGTLAHGASAVGDVMSGDYLGAALNAGAGIANLTPITAPIGIALDAANMARGLFGGSKETPQSQPPKFDMSHLQLPTQPQPQQQIPPMAINMGARGVNSLSTPPLKLAAAKTASMVDAVENALRGRMINKALDKVMMPAENAVQAPVKSEKELELVSQHPEMAKLLEDKQNKAYLQRLLMEQ
jgi:hypothetical protein